MHHGKTYLLCAFVAAFGLLVTWKVCRPRAQSSIVSSQQPNSIEAKSDTQGPRAFVFSNGSAIDALMNRSNALPVSLGLLAPSAAMVGSEGLARETPANPR